MGKILTTKINDFRGGIVNNKRDTRENVCRMVTGFDVFSNESKLTPYRASEDGDSGSSTNKRAIFQIALRTGSTYSLYSLGVIPGGGIAKVSYKALASSGSNSLGDDGWVLPGNGESPTGTTSFGLFIFYKKTGLIYGLRANRYLWAFSPSGTAWDNSARDLTSVTNITQGLVHSKDDILYIAYDNKILTNDNGSWNNDALTGIPSHFKINSIAEYGNYIAIACAPLSGIGDSVVFLWDRDSSLTTLSESINWGAEELKILDDVEGELIGISYTNPSLDFNSRVVFRRLVGSKAKTFEEFVDESTGILTISKQKHRDRLHFMLKITIDGVVRIGVWSIGKSSTRQGFSVVHERNPDDDTAINTGTTALKGFFYINDYLFQSFLDSSGDFDMTKTIETELYTGSTSIYEKFFATEGSSITKKLRGITVNTEALPENANALVAYKIDNESSFTTIFSNGVDNSISHSAINLESSGNSLPEYGEITFRIESTKGAEITGLEFDEELVDKRLY